MHARSLGIGLLGWAAIAAAAGPARADKLTAPPDPAVVSWQLDNGLTVAYASVPGAPMVAVQVWYRVGSKDDPKGKRGLASLFENLMFEGSTHLRPGAHQAYLERIGGDTGAAVTEDVSAFHDAVPVDQLDLALELEAERMRNLELDADSVARIRELGGDKLRQQTASPLFRVYLRLIAAAFVQHPYGSSTGGVASELAEITAADARAFYDAYYQANNALVVVTGGASEAEVRAAVAKWFGSIAKGATPPRPADGLVEPEQSALRREELVVGLGVVMAGFHIPAAREADVIPLQVLGQLLFGGKGARLERRLVGGKLASEVGGQVLAREHAGLLVAFARFDDASKADAIEDGIGAELLALKKSGPTAAELGRAKKQVAAGAYLASVSASGLANQIGVSWTLTGKADQFTRDVASVLAVSAADLERVIGRYLGKDHMTVVVGKQGGS